MAKLMLSVIIFAKNNAKTLPLVLAQASRHLIRDQISHEIIVVIDNSSYDASREIAERLTVLISNLRIIDKTNFGANTVIKGEYVLFLPADGSISVEEFHKMKRYLENDYDVVWGLRNYENSYKIIYNLLSWIPYLQTYLESASRVFCFKIGAFEKILSHIKLSSYFETVKLLQIIKNYQIKIKYLILNI